MGANLATEQQAVAGNSAAGVRISDLSIRFGSNEVI